MDFGVNNSYLLIDTQKIRQNISRLVETLPKGAELYPVLKCDAYGLGLEPIASIIGEFSDIKTIAVAQVQEGLRLRESGIKQDILVLGPAATSEQRKAALENDLILTVYRLGFIPELAADAWDSGRKAAVHLKIDTGLNRFGVRPGEELAEAIFELKRNSDAVAVKGVFSHFAELVQPDDKKTAEQYERFLSAIQQLKAAGISTGKQHICASAAYEYHPEMALDAVRLGRKLYFDNPKQPDGLIEEAASWRALITDIKMRRAGEKIGYGDGLVLPCDTTVATLGVGYGDGLMTALVQKQAPVLIGGKRARLLQCCMDMCFVDVSGIDCAIGDEATLFGRDAEGRQLSAREVAALIGDEGCTLTSALGNRVLRVYI